MKGIALIEDSQDARALLEKLGAQKKLLKHLELVGEAGEALVSTLEPMGVEFDDTLVRLGISVHDAGKIVHPNELFEKGDLHELAGEKLLVDHGVQAEIARCCVSHAKYDSMPVSFEELLVALADKLWKGKRVEGLELRVIDGVAELKSTDRWSVFELLDRCFEEIAARGDERLSRSRFSPDV